MGYAYTELIAPAILYLNPGVKREEFVNLLKEVHSSWISEYPREKPWDYYDSDWDKKTFHDGLRGLACILNLPETGKFKKFKKYKRDENDLMVDSPFLIKSDYQNQEFKVIIHEKNILEKEKNIYNEISFGKVKEGDNFAGGIVRKILREEKFEDDREEDGFLSEFIPT